MGEHERSLLLKADFATLDASTTKYLSLSILALPKTLRRSVHTLEAEKGGGRAHASLLSRPPGHPLSQHHPIEPLSVPFAHNSKKAPNLYPRRRSLLLHLQQKSIMAFNFHGPRATRDAQGYARTRPPRSFLQQNAPSLSDRGIFNARHTCVGSSS